MSQVVCVFVCVDGNGVVMLTHRVLIDSRHLLLTVLQAESPRSGHQHGRVLVEVLFKVADSRLLTVCSPEQRGHGVLRGLFYKGSNPIHGSPILMTSSPPQSPYLLILPPWGLSFNLWISRETNILQQVWTSPLRDKMCFRIKGLCLSGNGEKPGADSWIRIILTFIWL